MSPPLGRHAYLIMAHADFEVLRVLLSRLDDNRNDIYLHIDRKVRDVPDFNIVNARLFILDKRINVHWGSYRQIQLEMLLFSTAFKNGSYTYYHILSGVDLPLKSQDYIHRFFQENHGKEFVGYWPENDWQAEERITKYHFFMKYERGYPKYVNILFTRFRRLLQRTTQRLFGLRNTDFQPKKGPNWVSITHDFCKYLLSKENWIKKRFKHTYCGDEIFLQSILWNSPFRERLYDPYNTDNGSMREIDWERGTNSTPYTWQIKDKEYLDSSEKLFARKFQSKIYLYNINKSNV